MTKNWHFHRLLRCLVGFTFLVGLFNPFLLPSGQLEVQQDISDRSLQRKGENSTENQNHDRSIPNILIFTYDKNVLTAPIIELNLMEQVFQNNTLNTISLHPGAQVRFLDDNDCIAAIQSVYNNSTNMVHHFQVETEGMYKGDICRGAALYQTGGIYLDMDLVARMTLWDVIPPEVDFVVPQENAKPDPRYRTFYQAFIAAAPRHVVIRSYLDLFEAFYNKRIPRPINLLGVHFMKDAYYASGANATTTTRIWTEMIFQADLLPHIKPQSNNEACSNVIIAQPEAPNQYDPNMIVPFFTNVHGSKRCPL